MTSVNRVERPNVIWAIGGSDSGSGAGVQADLKTAQNMGVHCCQMITAITAQNSQSVQSVDAVDVEVLECQWQALEEDMPPSVIKIGLMANLDQIQWLAKRLDGIRRSLWLSQRPVIILDPVLSASCGDVLTDMATHEAVQVLLCPVVDIITANWEEAVKLVGLTASSSEATLIEGLHRIGVESVVLKGGHRPASKNDALKGYAQDVMSSRGQIYRATSLRHLGNGAHGTGCAFATMMACALAKSYPLKDAFVLAKAYVYRGIVNHVPIGKGTPCLGHQSLPDSIHCFPVVEGQQQALCGTAFPSCNTQSLGLYPVVDSVEWIARLLPLGIKTIQLRIKDKSAPKLRESIKEANRLAQAHEARLFINDHWQIAIEEGCYGVHLGQEDLDSADLDAIRDANVRLGVSTHGYWELLRAIQIKPSYLAIGAIFPTPTKDMTGQIQGVEKLASMLPLVEHTPVVAIGGITRENMDAVLATGVGSIALVTAITKAANPELATKQLMDKVAEYGE